MLASWHNQIVVGISLLSFAVSVVALFKSRRTEILSTSLEIFKEFNSEHYVSTRHKLRELEESSGDNQINFVGMSQKEREPFRQMVALICLISFLYSKGKIHRGLVLVTMATPLIKGIQRLRPFLETREHLSERAMIEKRFNYLENVARASRRSGKIF